jgi:hypothetical protein
VFTKLWTLASEVERDWCCTWDVDAWADMGLDRVWEWVWGREYLLNVQKKWPETCSKAVDGGDVVVVNLEVESLADVAVEFIW